MAQEPSSKDLLEAVKQQESGGRRYDKSGKLLEGPMTKYGTAKGEMQVLDLTTKDPGYGVKPARDDSPDERARVGRDYLAAMVKRYGDEKTALVAYNWGPGNTDRWLKKGGDFSRLPKETQNYVAKVTGSLGSTKLAQAPATTKVKKAGVQQAVYKAAPLSHPMLSQLGPNFQAAMAVSMLADEAEKEGKSEDEPSEAEKMLTQATVQPVALASVDLGYQSPFPAVAPASSAPAKQQLQAFKHGGVVRMENGGDPQVENKTASLEGADLPVSRSAKELKSYTEAMNPAVKVVTDDLGAGTRGQMLPSQPDVLELNYKLTPAEREVTTLHELEHSMDARGGDIYGRPNFAKMGGMDNNYRAYHLMGDDWGPITETVKNMVDNREKLEKFFGRPLDNSYFNKQFYNSVKEVQSPSALFKEQLASLAALEQTTGKFLTQDPEMRKLFPNTRMMAVFDALTGPRQTRLDARDLPPHTPVPSYTYETNPALRFIKKALTGENEYGTSYRPFPIKRANGGEVDYFQDPMGAPSAPVTADTLAKGKEFKAADALRMAKEFGTALGSNTESLVRGAVAQVPGAVGDLESLSRKGINFLYGPGGVNVSEKTVAPTSEEIRARVPRITATRPESSGMESMGELMAPGLAKAAAPVAKAAAKGTAKEMLRGMEGQGVLAPISPQESIMYAVKPRGGTFLTSGSMDKPPVSNLDKTLNQYLDATLDKIPNSDEAAPIIKEFFDKKARKYFTSEFGTGDDPLRRAISSGELQPINKDVDRFPEYLLHAARTKDAPGHDQARRDLEKAYDNASTLEARIVGIHDPADADARAQFTRLVEASKAKTQEALALEGVPQELQNIRINPISGQQLGVSHNAPYVAAINDFQNFPAQAGAIQKAESVYDLDYPGTFMQMFSPHIVAENLSVLPVNKLKNMSFADAMYEGAKRMEIFRNYDKAVEKVEKGLAVPKEILFKFTMPVLKTNNSNEWVKLTDKAATKMEGKMLHHSIGSYANSNSYGHGGREGFDKGIANVFSLRDPETGYAKATIEAKKLDDGTLMLSQHKGNFNSFPEKNVEDVFKLYDKLGKDNVSFSKHAEMYHNDATGTPLPRLIEFNWGKAYEHWKSTGTLPPIPTASEKLPPPPGQIDIPFAKGGMVERQVSTARYI